MEHIDIIQGKVIRVINGETFDIRIDVFNPANQGTYPSIERVLITDLNSPKLYQRWGFRIRKFFFNVQLSTIRKKRQRLRQVLTLTPNDNIKDYLSHTLTKRFYKY